MVRQQLQEQPRQPLKDPRGACEVLSIQHVLDTVASQCSCLRNLEVLPPVEPPPELQSGELCVDIQREERVDW